MTTYQAELYHHGIKGQRWGVRKQSTYIRKKSATDVANDSIWNDYYLDDQAVNKYVAKGRKMVFGMRIASSIIVGAITGFIKNR